MKDARIISEIDRFFYGGIGAGETARKEDGLFIKVQGYWIPVQDWNDGKQMSREYLIAFAKHFFQLGKTSAK